MNIKPAAYYVQGGLPAQDSTIKVPADNLYSLTRAQAESLSTLVKCHSHPTNQAEAWRQLSNEQIKQRPAAFGIHTVKNAMELASFLLGIAGNNQVMADMHSNGHLPIYDEIRDALLAFSQWFPLARELEARYVGIEAAKAYEDHKDDGILYAPPRSLRDMCTSSQ